MFQRNLSQSEQSDMMRVNLVRRRAAPSPGAGASRTTKAVLFDLNKLASQDVAPMKGSCAIVSERLSSEAELIKAAASGNRGAFAQLVRAHRARVLRVAFGIVGSADEAEDVAQQVFIKVWNSLPSYHPRGAFAAWLRRIAVNAAIDALRRQPTEVRLQNWQPDRRQLPEEAALRQDLYRRVREAVATVPPNARAALILREYEQLSYREIAEALQIPMGTVMSRLSYARRILKGKLAQEG